MPTEPQKKLLDRELSKSQHADIIANDAALLREIVNYSTHVASRCRTASIIEAAEDASVLMLYLQMIEMTDGIEVLISEAQANCAMPLLRSSFEAYLSLKYILEDDFKQRSLVCFTHYLHKQLEVFKKLKKVKAPEKASPDDSKSGFESLRSWEATCGDWADELKDILEDPRFSEIKIARKSLRSGAAWYTLCDKRISSLRKLAKHLGHLDHYEICYRRWSGVQHTSDSFRFLAVSTDGKPSLKQLRNSGMFTEVSFITAWLMLDATLRILKFFCSEDDFHKWFESDVQEMFEKTRLRSKNLSTWPVTVSDRNF